MTHAATIVGEAVVVGPDQHDDRLDVVRRRRNSCSASAWPLPLGAVVEVDAGLEVLARRRSRRCSVRAPEHARFSELRRRRRCGLRRLRNGGSPGIASPCAARCRSTRRAERVDLARTTMLVLPAQRPASPEMAESPSVTTVGVPTPVRPRRRARRAPGTAGLQRWTHGPVRACATSLGLARRSSAVAAPLSSANRQAGARPAPRRAAKKSRSSPAHSPASTPARDLGPVVEARLGEHVDHAARGARLRVGRAVDDARDAREDDRARAHRARLERHVERRVEDAPGAERARPPRAAR